MNKAQKISAVTGGIILLVTAVFLTIKFSPYKRFETFQNRSYSQVFYDRNGELCQVTSVEEGMKREYSSLQDYPAQLIQAVLEAEDADFYKHHGINFKSAVRAAGQNISNHRKVSGASTITMQLARMISPSKKRNFGAKIKDCINARRIENRLSKDEILQLYLNNIPFGSNIEGFTSAARYFFNSELKDLTIEQIYILAVIPRRPTTYSPFQNPDLCAEAAYKLFEKSNSVAKTQPADDNKLNISKEDFLDAAGKAKADNSQKKWPFEFPHFIEEVKKLNNDNKVYLTTDLDLQKKAEYEIRKALKDGENSRIENAALVVLENSTGNVLAWVGSNDWFDEEGGQIDGVKVHNQMGSSMKPFLYAFAMDNPQIALDANTVLPDVPMEFGSKNIYMPLNFNNRFNGPVRTRVALASSLNIPAVYILSLVGVDNYLELLYSLGFDSLKDGGRKADLGLALGAGEVSLEELTYAFSVFPRDGQYIQPVYFTSDTTSQSHAQIYSRDTARMICNILSDKSARVSGFGYTQTFETSYPSMFKTGTANQYQNIVALGATVDYTVGVWMGNFSGNTVMGKTGSSLPALVARKVLDYLTHEQSPDFTLPENYVREKICPLSGMKKGPHCPTSVFEYIKKSEIDSGEFSECTWHTDNSIVYPAIYQQWFNDDNRSGKIDYSSSGLKILSPKNNSLYYYGNMGDARIQSIPVEVIGGTDTTGELEIFYDEQHFYAKRPFRFDLPVEKGEHHLKVQLQDETDEIDFTVE